MRIKFANQWNNVLAQSSILLLLPFIFLQYRSVLCKVSENLPERVFRLFLLLSGMVIAKQVVNKTMDESQDSKSLKNKTLGRLAQLVEQLTLNNFLNPSLLHNYCSFKNLGNGKYHTYRRYCIFGL